MKVSKFLKKVKPFATLSDEELQYIGKRCKVEGYEPGQRIIERGTTGDAMYVIADGRVQIPIFDRENNHQFTAHLDRYEVFGEMALLTDSPRGADVYSEGPGPCICIVLSKAIIDELLTQNPVVARFLTDMLNERLLQSEQVRNVGKYRLDSKLGQGGMAVVYLGFHKDLHRQVAVKMLSHQLSYQPSFARRMEQEARLIAELRHPNIVAVYDAERAYGTYFIVMEVLRGQDLGELIKSEGPLPHPRARHILVQTLSALGYAHNKGILHRDIKPSNIFVEDDDNVKLMDFGLAGALNTAQSMSTAAIMAEKLDGSMAVGTVEYVAPEVVLGQQTDARRDIYALGITAYSMLAGELPFQGGTQKEMLLAHVHQPMPDIREKRYDVPNDLAEFVIRATAKNPANRFATCEEAEALLTAAAEGEGLDAAEGRLIAVFSRPSESRRVARIIKDTIKALRQVEGTRISVSDLTKPQ